MRSNTEGQASVFKKPCVDSNLTSSLDSDTFARALYCSRTHLHELVRSRFGCGVAGYIRMARLDRAAYPLTATEPGFSDIAEQTGYADYNCFSRSFRKEKGMSLKDWRTKTK